MLVLFTASKDSVCIWNIQPSVQLQSIIHYILQLVSKAAVTKEKFSPLKLQDWLKISLLDGYKASSIKDASINMGWLKESMLYHISAEISTAARGRASIVSPVRVLWRGEGACSPHLHCTPPPTQVVTVSVHWQSWKQCSWSRWMSQRCAWSGPH